MADITYGTNNEFGFDYLRDNMVQDLAAVRAARAALRHRRRGGQHPHRRGAHAADHLRARRRSRRTTTARFAQLVRRLHARARLHGRREGPPRHPDRGRHRPRRVSCSACAPGRASTTREHYELTPYLDNALRANVLYQLDRDYIVKDGEVIIVDEFTGRLMYGRRFSEGLHQAIEAKEGVRVQRESLTLATITFQNYFRMYEKLAGMTGTAHDRGGGVRQDLQPGRGRHPDPPAGDPRRLPRPGLQDRSRPSSGRWSTRSRSCTRRASRCWWARSPSRPPRCCPTCCKRKGVPHNVLNAKQHETEAGIIAQAGRPGTVTIATNMAGRGVDILLGGNPDGLARERLRKRGRRPGRAGRGRPGLAGRRWREAKAEVEAGPRRRCSPPAACTSSAPSATRRGASTTSCAAAPAARATPARRASSSRWKTT